MPINTVMNLAFSGQNCGVPFAVSMAYIQLLEDPADETPTGRQLVLQWLNQEPGPWTHIREFLGETFKIECAVVSYNQISETILLQGVDGLGDTASWPSPYALQVECAPQDPHADDRHGRFYWPGFLLTSSQFGGVKDTMGPILRTWMTRLQFVDNTDLDWRYRLYPHINYEAVNQPLAPPCSLPYFHPIIKNIGNRRADDCATFASGGGGQFDPVEGPEPPPGP